MLPRQIFKHTINYRRERWKNFRAHISSRAKAQFTYLLSERSFRGRLLTDHEKKMLDLQVRRYPTTFFFSFSASNCLSNRSSRISPRRVQAVVLRRCQVARSRSPKSAFFCHSGKPWDHLFAASTSCTCSNFQRIGA